jgi:hypothetical protein
MMATPKTDALLRKLNYGEPDDGYPLWAREMRELEEQNAELVVVLQKLVNEVQPCLLEMARHAIGNTNVAVITLRIAEAETALEKVKGS